MERDEQEIRDRLGETILLLRDRRERARLVEFRKIIRKYDPDLAARLDLVMPLNRTWIKRLYER